MNYLPKILSKNYGHNRNGLLEKKKKDGIVCTFKNKST